MDSNLTTNATSTLETSDSSINTTEGFDTENIIIDSNLTTNATNILETSELSNNSTEGFDNSISNTTEPVIIEELP